MNKKDKLVTGNPFKTLLFFSLPMILSVTLQQFYNICDSMIAGRMISDNSLSAVSATYPITVVYLAIAVGFGVGANIITARYIGEKKYNTGVRGLPELPVSVRRLLLQGEAGLPAHTHGQAERHRKPGVFHMFRENKRDGGSMT